MGCPTEIKQDFITEEIVKTSDNTISTGCKENRNKMSADRLRYFGHLYGGLKSVLYSRFLANTQNLSLFRTWLQINATAMRFLFLEISHSGRRRRTDIPEIQKLYGQAKKEGFMNTILWGGEPLLRQDFTEIAKASYDNGMYTKIATNGWYLTDNHEFGNYVDLMFVSIDAIGEKHDIIRGNRWGFSTELSTA